MFRHPLNPDFYQFYEKKLRSYISGKTIILSAEEMKQLKLTPTYLTVWMLIAEVKSVFIGNGDGLFIDVTNDDIIVVHRHDEEVGTDSVPRDTIVNTYNDGKVVQACEIIRNLIGSLSRKEDLNSTFGYSEQINIPIPDKIEEQFDGKITIVVGIDDIGVKQHLLKYRYRGDHFPKEMMVGLGTIAKSFRGVILYSKHLVVVLDGSVEFDISSLTANGKRMTYEGFFGGVIYPVTYWNIYIQPHFDQATILFRNPSQKANYRNYLDSFGVKTVEKLNEKLVGMVLEFRQDWTDYQLAI